MNSTSRLVPTKPRRGFTLIETAMSSLLVGILIAASMQTVGTVARVRNTSHDKSSAALLAHQLLAEILDMDYQESTGTPAFGTETGETSRSLYDDIDDYHNLSESPPSFRDGTSMTSYSGWTRSVSVTEVGTTDSLLTSTLTVGTTPVGIGLKSGTTTATGVRRITVTVKKNGTTMATAVGHRTKSWTTGT